MTVSDVPRISSYAFSDGKRRGLVLVSNDPRSAQPSPFVSRSLVDGSGRAWYLESPDIQSTNERDWAPEGPQVSIVEREIAVTSGMSLMLPPANVMAISWEIE